MSMTVGGQYELTTKEFDELRKLVLEHTGITLADSKMELVKRRFTPRLRALALASFSEYARYLRAHPDDELVDFSNAITTNLTGFFRENHHFDFMAETALPDLLRRNAASRRLRIWSSACSTGQEPYSIAITLAEHMPELANWDVRILATDLDRNCLRTAEAGVYQMRDLEKVPKAVCSRWFLRGKGENQEKVKVRAGIRKMVSFKPLNLIQQWPMREPFDIIFCRNVFIYFDRPRQSEIVGRFAQLQAPGSYLCIGHSESLHGFGADYELMGQTIYRRLAPGKAGK
jgi:chemotaxis protein methyltransferase CheR